MQPALTLADKLALVTGASGDIGSAIARRLASDGSCALVHYGSGRASAQAAVRSRSSRQDATDESLDLLFNVNVRAVFVLAREAALRMNGAGRGRIINIGSVFGKAVPGPGLSIYSGTKIVGAAGVTVNVVQPAVIQAEPVPADGRRSMR